MVLNGVEPHTTALSCWYLPALTCGYLQNCWSERFRNIVFFYLHQRTAGMIGSLSHLIRGAALDAILTGTEKITKKLLDAVDLDHAAQNHARHPNAARRP